MPRIKPKSLVLPVSQLTRADLVGHALVPVEWVPRCGVLVATRMGDSGLAPHIPLGATVILDRRPMTTEQAIDKLVAMHVSDRGVRLRRLVRGANERFLGETGVPGNRGSVAFRPARGDVLLGRVIGQLAQLT